MPQPKKTKREKKAQPKKKVRAVADPMAEILASLPAEIRSGFESCEDDFEIQAAAKDGTGNKLPTFRMRAYTGGVFKQPFGRVVVDLAGIKSRAKTPILWGHDTDKPVGHSESTSVEPKRVMAAGVISGDQETEHVRQVLTLGKNKFPLQASIGANNIIWEWLDEGEDTEVNGRKVSGPLYIARKSDLAEISIVVNGADNKTDTKIAATAAGKVETMPKEFVEWLKARGITKAAASALDEKVLEALKASWESEVEAAAAAEVEAQAKADADAKAKADAGNEDPKNKQDDPAKPLKAAAEDGIAKLRAEPKRIADIQAICKPDGEPEKVVEKLAEVQAKAIVEGWDTMQTELESIRARYASVGPAIHPGKEAPDTGCIEAALCLQARLPEEDLLKDYGEQTMEHAGKIRGVSLREAMAMAARLSGVVMPNVFAGNEQEFIRAAFSTTSLPGILGNVANKSMLAAYRSIASVARELCKITSVNDFKQHTRYRLNGSLTFEEVGPTGELKHGTVSEQSFTQQADTYGKYFSLSRRDIVNDDLGAFLEIPRLIGRGAALNLEQVFFTLLLSNPGSFFSSGNGNLISGAATALSIASLTVAEQKFLDQTDPNGDPILITPAWLVVPTSLKVTAESLFEEKIVNETTTASAKSPRDNPHAGKFRPIASPYLNNANYTGYSATAWYLWGNPADVPAFDLAFLNGVDAPVIEEVALPGDVLGTAWRGYQDFGIKEQDPRAATKSAGA